jgi:hypothetical protein
MSTEIGQPAAPRKWYQIWLDIWQHPGTQPFVALLNEPDHDVMRGFIWVAVTSLLLGLVSTISTSRTLVNVAPAFSRSILYSLCLVVVTPIVGVIGLIITGGIYHGISKLLGGQGTWAGLVICIAALVAPGELLAVVINLFTLLTWQVPFLIFIPWIISIGVGIYSMILYINALKAAEKLETGKAVLIYFIPVIVVVILTLCIMFALIPTTRLTQ